PHIAIIEIDVGVAVKQRLLVKRIDGVSHCRFPQFPWVSGRVSAFPALLVSPTRPEGASEASRNTEQSVSDARSCCFFLLLRADPLSERAGVLVLADVAHRD